MESLPANQKVEILVHRFISTLQKRIELRKKRMKNNEDDTEGSRDNFLSNEGHPKSYSLDVGSVGKDLSSKDGIKPLTLSKCDELPVWFMEVPSYSRIHGRPSTSPGVINRQLGPLITKRSVPGQNVVPIRGQDGDEEIPEEEAVCKFCFNVLKEEDIVLKTVCGCKNALTHEECASNWSREKGNSNCDSCGQEVQNFHVTLLRDFNSSQRIDNQRNNRRRTRFKIFMSLCLEASILLKGLIIKGITRDARVQ